MDFTQHTSPRHFPIFFGIKNSLFGIKFLIHVVLGIIKEQVHN